MAISIQAQGVDFVRHSSNQAERVSQRQNKNQKNIFAGNINLTEDPIAQRRRQAQQQALKLVRNAWENDKSVKDEVQMRKENYAAYETALREAEAGLADNQEDEKVLQTLYGVADDSQEQKDLELLKKEQDYQNHVGESPTEEEKKRLSEIDRNALTEYQQRALSINKRSVEYKKTIESSKQVMQTESANIKRILLEKLKSDPMVKAQKAADTIRDAANDEILGMLVSEATDHMDEKLEEEKEKAEEKKEEQEKKDEQIEQMELKRAVTEAMVQKTEEAVQRAKAKEREQETPEMDMTEMLDIEVSNASSQDVQQGLSDIKSSMKLLAADLKGIRVDEEI